MFSDIRLKDVKGDFSRGLDDVLQINPINYSYKTDNAKGFDSTKEYIGLVAQDVEKVIPEAVFEDEDGYKVINNDPIIWTMLNSIKELKAENDELRGRIEALEAK